MNNVVSLARFASSRSPARQPEASLAGDSRTMSGRLPAGSAAATHIPAASELSRAGMVDAEDVIARLEEAGRTLLALPGTGYSTRLRTSNLDIVRAAEMFAPAQGRVRPAVPSPAQVSRMDEALGWVTLIPRDRHVLRRIVGARSLVSPTSERHLYSWRRLGVLLGADHKAVQRWHATGIGIIVALLNARKI